MIQNNWVSLPRLEYTTEENRGRTKYSSVSQSTYTAGRSFPDEYLVSLLLLLHQIFRRNPELLPAKTSDPQ